MFGKKKWRNAALIEGEKEAIIISRMEGLPEPSHDFDGYPVDMTFPKKVTFYQAVKKAKMLSQRHIYNVFYKAN